MQNGSVCSDSSKFEAEMTEPQIPEWERASCRDYTVRGSNKRGVGRRTRGSSYFRVEMYGELGICEGVRDGREGGKEN